MYIVLNMVILQSQIVQNILSEKNRNKRCSNLSEKSRNKCRPNRLQGIPMSRLCDTVTISYRLFYMNQVPEDFYLYIR